MTSQQPGSGDVGRARGTICDLREGAVASAQKSLVQLLARMIAKAWRQSHAKTRERDTANLADSSPPVTGNPGDNQVQSTHEQEESIPKRRTGRAERSCL